ESQKMAAFARTDLDLLGLARRDNQAAVQLFVIRGGKAIGRDVFLLDVPRGTTDEEVLSGFLLQYYGRATNVPREIAVPMALPDVEALEAFLAARRGVTAYAAAEMLAPGSAGWLPDQRTTRGALEDRADALAPPTLPSRIECYDISNVQVSETVGSMVVFEDGKPRTGEYRRCRIRGVEGPNDV